ncbi:hypothetical protein [Bartonella machadoae]|uniref:hypothetical protein n=1 Tax=Bartonella machadoae TaxID=2893471 RepID=UPI001F4CBDA3|nr:hypothetical protein [Bartonella machadoae]UNE54045.1 hypothetical protein LNM86_10900 [Bartonella machadoae]
MTYKKNSAPRAFNIGDGNKIKQSICTLTALHTATKRIDSDCIITQENKQAIRQSPTQAKGYPPQNTIEKNSPKTLFT